MANENETRDPFARTAKGMPHMLGIGTPAGNPASRETERMRAVQKVHPGGAAGQFLFPDWNLVVRDRRKDEHRELAWIMGEAHFLLAVSVCRARILLSQSFEKQTGKLLALIFGNGDEPPGG